MYNLLNFFLIVDMPLKLNPQIVLYNFELIQINYTN